MWLMPNTRNGLVSFKDTAKRMKNRAVGYKFPFFYLLDFRLLHSFAFFAFCKLMLDDLLGI